MGASCRLDSSKELNLIAPVLEKGILISRFASLLNFSLGITL